MELIKGFASVSALMMVIAGAYVESSLVSWVLLGLGIVFAAIGMAVPLIAKWRLDRPVDAPVRDFGRRSAAIPVSSWNEERHG